MQKLLNEAIKEYKQYNLIKSNGVLYYSKYVDEDLEYTFEDYKKEMEVDRFKELRGE